MVLSLTEIIVYLEAGKHLESLNSGKVTFFYLERRSKSYSMRRGLHMVFIVIFLFSPTD